MPLIDPGPHVAHTHRFAGTDPGANPRAASVAVPPARVLRHLVIGHGLGPGDAVLVAGPLAGWFDEFLSGLGLRVRREDETRAVERQAAGGGFDAVIWAGEAAGTAVAAGFDPTADLTHAVRTGGQAITLAHTESTERFADGSSRVKRFPDARDASSGWACRSRTVLVACRTTAAPGSPHFPVNGRDAAPGERRVTGLADAA